MKRRDDSNQLLIDWTATPSPPAASLTSGGDIPDREAGRAAAAPPTSPPPDPAPSLPPPVQRLPWDFKTTFPQPTDEAIDAGVIDASDLEPENLKAMHEQYAAEMLATLRAIDRVTDARRRGVDPATGRPPKTHAAREKLRQFLQEEPGRLERYFTALTEVYENAFGGEAADAFSKALRAWYAGVEVVGDTNVVDMPPRRTCSRLPTPKPLPTRVAAGTFGRDDHGDPIRPSRDEIHAITEQHAEKLIDMMEQLQAVGRSLHSPHTDKARLYAERDRVKGLIRSAVTAYGEDFGQDAARQLERYAEREAKKAAVAR